MFSLTLNGKIFSSGELKHVLVDETQSEFEKSTLVFCKAWLSGQKEFRIRTSGSTGTPKEIVLKREAMEGSAQSTIRALQLKTGDTSLVCLDTKYVAGQMMLVRSLILGMNIVATEPTSNPFHDLRQTIDFTALVPYQLEVVLNQAPEKLDQVRCAIVGGASVSRSLKEKIKNIRCSIYATYGMTETISHIALQKLNGANAQDYFEALENVQLRLDERGCLCIKASHLVDEVVTNDLVELIDDKNFRWLGRIDNVINSGGLKIIPEKVEAVLENIFDSMGLPNRFFVAGIADNKFGQRVVIICEGSILSQTAQSQILEKVNLQLSKYEAPKELMFIPKFVETANGKVNRLATLK